MNSKNIPIKRLHELLTYNSETGLLFWKPGDHERSTDIPIGYPDTKGHLHAFIDGEHVLVHRVAWAMHYGCWPEKQIDHKDPERPADNRIDNLRQATSSQNKANQRKNVRNTSGFKGVHPHKSRFRARIGFNGKRRSLGLYDTAEEAHEVYCLAADMIQGEFARHA